MTATTTMAWLSHRDHLLTADCRTGHCLAFIFGILLMLTWIPTTFGQNVTTSEDLLCITKTDKFIGNAQTHFRIIDWMKRGICIRKEAFPNQCYHTLEKVLDNLAELRKAEYAGAAGVLSLLPTIGALLGAPTNEIWRLMSIIPFGGGLAMALSFGGAIMPVKVEDYEHVINKRNIAIGSIISLRNNHGLGRGAQETIEDKLRSLVDRIRQRIDQRESARLSKKHLTIGLTGMVLLLIGSQAAMTIIEQGGVIAWFCYSHWWMHLWYLMGMSDIDYSPGVRRLTLVFSHVNRGHRELGAASLHRDLQVLHLECGV